MEIQQHDGVVVEAARSRQGFAKFLREGEVLRGEEGGARGLGVQPFLPPLYIGGLGGCSGPGDPISREAVA